ncbi:MAG: lipoate--protein ligase [bacterium]
MHTRIIRSTSHDPWHNLALEEALLQDVAPNEVILYLWQNEHTIVIGRNQNAWKEARWKELEGSNGKLARRLSGGGAVYHDLGNLNFTFVMDRSLYDLHRQLEVILRGVRKLGIDAEFSGRNDLVADSRKFSGNAFLLTPDAGLHHGTVLVNAKMEDLGKYLQVSQDKIQSKGVTSVQSRMVNLTEFNPEITVEKVAAALQEAFLEVYGGEGEVLSPAEVVSDLTPLYEKFSSWEWRYGRTPKFDVSFTTRFEWGGVEIGFTLEEGQVSACTLFTDAMDSELFPEIAAYLEQIPFHAEAIQKKLDEVPMSDDSDKQIIADLKQFLAEQQV